MFQQRQTAEINPLSEVSLATIAPGAVANTSIVYVAAAFKLGSVGGTPATFALGDQLEIFGPAGAALNGVNVAAAPTATAGTAGVYFTNNTGGSITPVSGPYTIIATRLPPTLVS